MEIISYNIWDLPLWFLRNRDKRLLEIAQFLTDRGSEIICLQESWNLQHRALFSAHMRKHGYHDAVQLAKIKRNNGGLLTFSTFPIKSVRFIAFGRWGVSVSEFIGNKGVLETIVETPKGLLRVLNIHLHYESSRLLKTTAIRRHQLRKLFSFIKNDPAMPTLLAGDFNQDHMLQTPTFRKLFEQQGFFHHEDATATAPTYRAENPLVNNWINRVSASKRYDYILFKDVEQLGLVVNTYDVLYMQVPLSDHDPVILSFQ